MAERDTTLTADGAPPVKEADGSNGGVLGFTSRETLAEALSRRSDGRLQLDPGQAR